MIFYYLEKYSMMHTSILIHTIIIEEFPTKFCLMNVLTQPGLFADIHGSDADGEFRVKISCRRPRRERRFLEVQRTQPGAKRTLRPNQLIPVISVTP